MKLRNILIVVKDIARARKYYHDLFGLDMLLDNDENMILTEGLVLQQEACWTESLNKAVLSRNNHSELTSRRRILRHLRRNWNSYILRLNMSAN